MVFPPIWRKNGGACKLSWTLFSPARVQPLYGAGRKESSGTGLGPPIQALYHQNEPPSLIEGWNSPPPLNGQPPPTGYNTSVNTETGGNDHSTYCLTDVEEQWGCLFILYGLNSPRTASFILAFQEALHSSMPLLRNESPSSEKEPKEKISLPNRVSERLKIFLQQNCQFDQQIYESSFYSEQTSFTQCLLEQQQICWQLNTKIKDLPLEV